MQRFNTRARSGGRRAGRPQPMAEINIIPLVDVVLVLLIIFMATTAFVKESGLKMQLPAAQSGTATNAKTQDMTVVLTRDNLLLLDGQNTTEANLKAQLQARVNGNPQVGLTIKGDQGIPYSRVVRVIDLARQAGLASVALGTRFPDQRVQG